MTKQQYITRKDKFNFYGSFSKEIGLEIRHCNKDKIYLASRSKFIKICP